MNKAIFLSACLILVGCSDKYTIDQEIMQESLLKKCEDVLPYDYPNTGEGWILMAKEWSSLYHNCAIRTNGLIDAIQVNK